MLKNSINHRLAEVWPLDERFHSVRQQKDVSSHQQKEHTDKKDKNGSSFARAPPEDKDLKDSNFQHTYAVLAQLAYLNNSELKKRIKNLEELKNFKLDSKLSSREENILVNERY